MRSKKGHQFRGRSIFHAKSSGKQKKGHQVRRCPIFHAKSNEEQKNMVIMSAEVQFSTQNQGK